MIKANQDIRRMAKENGIYFWQIAEEYGVADATFTRKMRKELPKVEKERIFSIIAKIKSQKE